jgi:hypothetical protein
MTCYRDGFNYIYIYIIQHFAEKRRSLGRYSSLTDSDHGVLYIIKFGVLRHVVVGKLSLCFETANQELTNYNN